MKHRRFIDTLVAIIAHFVTICKDIYNSPHKLSYWNKKYNKIAKSPINFFFPKIFYSQTEIDNYLSSINYTTHDLLIYTDGSHEYNEDKINFENVSSIGIYIEYNHSEYFISQPKCRRNRCSILEIVGTQIVKIGVAKILTQNRSKNRYAA